MTLDPVNPVFPGPSSALTEPDGLLAVGGNLQPQTLLKAYREGIFPWYEEGQPVLWWSPAQRSIIRPGDLHISRSLAKSIRQGKFKVTTDQDFPTVIKNCAAPRAKSHGTWITVEMQRAYIQLNQLNHAHSLEVWLEDELVGGLYGVTIGSVFCGESMFSHVPDASKIALAALSQTLFRKGFKSIDCQLPNPHLENMGAIEIPRSEFLNNLYQWRKQPVSWPEYFSLN